MANEKANRGRSAEARDPNRPVDPETGEKWGLGKPGAGPVPPDADETDTEPEPTEPPAEPPAEPTPA